MTKRLLLVAALIMSAASLFFSPAFAAYTWVDDNGAVHIADYPKPVKHRDTEEDAAGPDTSAKTARPVSSPAKQAGPAAASAPSSTGTPVSKPLATATGGGLSSAGTLTIKSASSVSLPTATQGGGDAMATGATMSQLTTTATPSAMQARIVIPVPQQPDQMPAAGIMAFVMAFFMIIVVLVIGIYVYFSLCLYLIAKKLNVPSPWMAWIPLVNIWTLMQAAGKPAWWIVLLFIPLVGFVVIIHVWMCITENLGRNKWLGLLILLPIVSLVYIGVLAFSKQEQMGDSLE